MTIPNLSPKIIFKYGTIIILLLNLPALFYFYKFAEKYVYNTIYINNDLSFMEIRNRTENLKINDFEIIIQSIKEKSSEKSVASKDDAIEAADIQTDL